MHASAWAVLLIAGPVGTAHAANFSVPHEFTANTPALAAQVNANFEAVEREINSDDTRLRQLETMVNTLTSQVAALQSDNSAQASQISALQSQASTQQSAINAIQASNVMLINPYVRLLDIADPNNATPYATVRLTGVNLQVVDGSADTSGATNGLGNVIVGYNEASGSAVNPERCSLPAYDNGPDCVFNGAVWSRNHRNGSHNLVVGRSNSYSSYGGLVAGQYGLVNANSGSISGGSANTVSGIASSISGGQENVTTAFYASVSGGTRNLANASIATVSGGHQNTASGLVSTVSGGYQNVASGQFSVVGGGSNRSTTDIYDWRAGSLLEGN